MTTFRPECKDANPGSAYINPTDALYMIGQALNRRRSLAYGALHRNGRDCAVGAFFTDNPKCSLDQKFIDLVAAVNDQHPEETPHQRWLRVNRWIKWKLQVLKNGGKVVVP